VGAIQANEPTLDGIRNPEKQPVLALLNLYCAAEFAFVEHCSKNSRASLWPQVSHKRP